MIADPEEVRDLLDGFRKTEVNIKKQITDICFFSKGGINLEQAWGMSFADRDIAVEVITRRLKEMSGDTTEYL